MNIEDALQKLRDIRASFQAKMIAGTCGGGASIGGQMVNYRASVIANVELGKVIEQIESDMKAESDASDASYEPLADVESGEGIAIKDAYEQEA